MKTLTKILFALLLTISYHTNAQKFDTALEYLEFLGKEQEIVTKSTWK